MLNVNDPESQADLLAEILDEHKIPQRQPGRRRRRRRPLARRRRRRPRHEAPRRHRTQPGQFPLRRHRHGPAAHSVLSRLLPLRLRPSVRDRSRIRQHGRRRRSRTPQDLNTASQKLTDTLAKTAFDVESQAQRIDRDTGWAYVGIDLSPAPSKDVSIGAALEDLTTQPFGSSGTLTAAATVTAAIRDITRQAHRLQRPHVADPRRFAPRRSAGAKAISPSTLSSATAPSAAPASTPCPCPATSPKQRLDLIIGDMASLAFKWHKPLSARLLPVAGKGRRRHHRVRRPLPGQRHHPTHRPQVKPSITFSRSAASRVHRSVPNAQSQDPDGLAFDYFNIIYILI